jgi:glycosyltransferase involved in cell wall biosynthesis
MGKLLIDVTRLLDRALKGRLPSGVDRVSLAYVRHFANRATALVRFGGRWVELGTGDSQRVFDVLLAPDARFGRVVRWCVICGYALRWRSAVGPRVLLNAGHSGLDHRSYAIQARRRGLSPVYFLHDIIPITHPEYCRPGEADKHHLRLETMVAGRGLIVNSAATRAALDDYARAVGWSLPPCVIAPLAPASLPAPASTRPLAEPYFVVLSTIEPRKNHLLLLHAWRELIEEHGQRAPRLVVIGHRGWECEQVVDMLERCEALRGFVVEESRCDDAQLATWLHHAQALLFPSFIEGFGMPLVEALANGLPVIASGLQAFREIAGEIPEYLDPLDGPGWKRAILGYADTANPRRLAQMDRLRAFSAPTWETHFAKVDALLETVNGQQRP